jgi:hypothetical protein
MPVEMLDKPDISQDLQLLRELNCEWEWSSPFKRCRWKESRCFLRSSESLTDCPKSSSRPDSLCARVQSTGAMAKACRHNAVKLALGKKTWLPLKQCLRQWQDGNPAQNQGWHHAARTRLTHATGARRLVPHARRHGRRTHRQGCQATVPTGAVLPVTIRPEGPRPLPAPRHSTEALRWFSPWTHVRCPWRSKSHGQRRPHLWLLYHCCNCGNRGDQGRTVRLWRLDFPAREKHDPWAFLRQPEALQHSLWACLGALPEGQSR